MSKEEFKSSGSKQEEEIDEKFKKLMMIENNYSGYKLL